jgi:tetratricopeptide (TPR) repeat protein
MAAKVARHPNVAFLRNEYGNLLLKVGRLEEGLAQYELALELDPESPWLWNNLGVANQALRRYSKAKRAYSRAIAISPNYAMAYYNLGVVYDLRGNYSRALDHYQRAIELDPELLDLRKNPQVASNRHLAAVLIKSYIERGGSVVLPIESSLPEPSNGDEDR